MTWSGHQELLLNQTGRTRGSGSRRRGNHRKSLTQGHNVSPDLRVETFMKLKPVLFWFSSQVWTEVWDWKLSQTKDVIKVWFSSERRCSYGSSASEKSWSIYSCWSRFKNTSAVMKPGRSHGRESDLNPPKTTGSYGSWIKSVFWFLFIFSPLAYFSEKEMTSDRKWLLFQSRLLWVG